MDINVNRFNAPPKESALDPQLSKHTCSMLTAFHLLNLLIMQHDVISTLTLLLIMLHHVISSLTNLSRLTLKFLPPPPGRSIRIPVPVADPPRRTALQIRPQHTRLMEALRVSDAGDVAELVCEFLEVCVHQLLCVRELYPPAIFERRRHFNVPVQCARHPDLKEYIHSTIADLQPWIQQGAVEKIAVLFRDGNQIPVEKVVFKLCLKQVTGLPISHLEFALRGFLLKLCVQSDSAPLPPDCSWELVAYMKSLSAETASNWIPADENYSNPSQSCVITAIKSMRSGYLDMQLYVERPVEAPPKGEPCGMEVSGKKTL